jgi:hypothetical protein
MATDNPHGPILDDHPSSPCARRVRITLVEKGLAWETQLIDLARLEQRQPEYLRLIPNGFVPTLAHGERVVYTSRTSSPSISTTSSPTHRSTRPMPGSTARHRRRSQASA